MFFLKNKPYVLSFNYACCLVVIAGYFFYCPACKSDISKDDHADYFNPVFKKVDTTNDAGKEQAFAYMDAAFYAFKNAGTGDKYERLKRKKDFYYGVKKDYLKAMLYTDSLLLLLEKKLKQPRFALLYTNALFVKGDIFFDIKNYTESFHYYSLARLAGMENIADSCNFLSGYSGRLAMLTYAQNKYLLAAHYFMQNFRDKAICEKDNFLKFVYMQKDVDAAGMCYTNVGMLDSASFYFNATLNFIDSNAYKFTGHSAFIQLAKAVVYGNQAEVLDKKGKAAEAEKLFTKSIADAGKEDIPYTQLTQAKLAGIYLKTNQLQKADDVLARLKASLDTVANEAALVNWYQLKTDYYTRQKQVPAAFAYIKQYLVIKDSLDKRDKAFAGIDLNREFENMEQKSRNEKLAKDNETKSVYLMIAVLISVMAVAIILLIGYNLKRSAAFNREVQEKNIDLQKTLSSLEQSHKENNRIIRIVAHDLKNPISAIHNIIYSLLKKDYPDTLKETLEVVRTACINSMSLIKELLNDRNKLSASKTELVDMGKLLKSCVELLQAKADEKEQQLHLATAPVELQVNRQRIWRVMSNIINNAIKFSPPQTVINIKLEQHEKTVLVSVQDNGIGIPDELKSGIFTISPEEARTGTAGEESYGLGLSISRKIIDEHSGKIWFDSTVGVGSVFYVELPNLNGHEA